MWAVRRTSALLGQARLGSLRPSRALNLQEYQSKGLLREAGVTVQDFVVAASVPEAREKLEKFKVEEYVVKAMVLAGGRGKGTLSSGLKGGVKLTKDAGEALGFVEQMVGHRIVTKQTPAEGVRVERVMIAESVVLVRETYLAILLDREAQGPVIVASPAGGMDIEEVAEKQPHLIFKEPVDIVEGLTDEAALRIAGHLQFKGELQRKAAEEIHKLYQLFLDVDATQIEINPLSETGCMGVFAVDAKLNFDDSARFRQEKVFALDDGAESDPREAAAERHGLNFVPMDGNIACLVNGAGLAMATMDIIKLHGGEPANFLDVGGGVGEAQVAEAFKLIASEPSVSAIFVNVFAGIIDCATIARGIVGAVRSTDLRVPLVVRLDGNNAPAALDILAQSGLPITTANELDDAAAKAVAASRAFEASSNTSPSKATA